MSKIKNLGLIGSIIATGFLGYAVGNFNRDKIPGPRNEQERMLVESLVQEKHNKPYSPTLSECRISPSLGPEIPLYALILWPFFYRAAKRETEKSREKF